MQDTLTAVLWISARVLLGCICYNTNMLTTRQKQIKDFVEKIFSQKEVAPTEREIARHFRISPSTAHEHLEALKEKGYMQKKPRRARAITITPPPTTNLIRIPLLGTIAAGQPIEAIQDKETIAVPKSQIPNYSNVYALRVAGNSMIDEHGDVILVRQQTIAENGQKVVALIDNYETTLKKFYKEQGHIRLQPANKTMEPIIIRSDRDISIQGIVLDVIHEENSTSIILPKFKKKIIRNKKLPLNKIVLGDALQELKKLPDESCDVIVIDPPYNIGKDFGNNIDKRDLDDYISWSKNWITESIRILKPAGTLFIYGFSEILAYLSVEVPINKRWLIWHYTNKNVASLEFWQRSHEAIICAWKDKPIFNKDAVREPYTEGFLNGAAGKVRKGTIGRFSKSGLETIYKAHEGGALPRDVIKIPALAGGAGMIERWFLCKTCNNVYEPRQLPKHVEHEIMKHPTQKPLELSKKLIKSAMPKKNGVVLVPFVGTGSECVAAKELGQNYIGFELNPDYIRMAEKWLTLTKTKTKLF